MAKMSGMGCSSSQRPAAPRARACRGHAGPGTPSPRRSCRPSSGRPGGGSARARRRDPSRATRIQHVLQQFLAGGVAVAGPLGRVDVAALRQAVEIRVSRTARQRRGRTRRARRCRPPARGSACLSWSRPPRHHGAHSWPIFSAPGRRSSGAGDRPWDASTSDRRASTRPQVAQVGHDLLGEELEECRVFQSGMLPLWNRQNRWPIGRPLDALLERGARSRGCPR
jgi:hypothetical protein